MSLIDGNISLFTSSLDAFLPKLQDADEIKVMLYILLQESRHEGNRFYLTVGQLENSTQLRQWLGECDTNLPFQTTLNNMIEARLLLQCYEKAIMNEPLLFLNDDKGRQALEALRAGKWRPLPTDHQSAKPPSDEKNIFQLYEENIGPLTPLLAEDLAAAQEEHPQAWIKDAIHIAVQNNARSWRYIDTILRSWQKEGKHDQPGRDSQPNKRKPAKGKFDDFIQR
ncbi:MAG TPA: DnaD domain protein [Chloroflexi bacterium]|nr:DnaD domain protein [Chloroflexota bacterium]